MCYSTSSQLHSQWGHIGSLKLVMVTWKLESATSQGWIYCFVDYLDLRKWWENVINADYSKLCYVCSCYIMHSPKIEEIVFQCSKLLSSSTKKSFHYYRWKGEVLTCLCCFTVVLFINVSRYINQKLRQDYLHAINNMNRFLLNCIGCLCQNMVELQL